MASGTSAFERALLRAVPKLDASHAPGPRELCAGVWTLERRLRHFGLGLLPTRTTLLRLSSGSLVMISPPPLVDAACAEAIRAIGPVSTVVVPNVFHYLYTADLYDSPLARDGSAPALLTAPGLAGRVPELASRLAGRAPAPIELGAEPPPAWSGEIEHLVLGPVGHASEVLLFHVPSGTLVLTDLAFNMQRYPRPIDRVFWRLSGIPKGFGPGRTTRRVLLRDPEAAAPVLARAAEWPIRRILVAHGEAIEDDARERFRNAFL